MSGKQWLVAAMIGLSIGCAAPKAQAGDLRIPLPKGDLVTPVQRLNRDGVKAIRKHDYERARELFYKAYLYDPDDPFTLNNLGYVAEMEGHLERARRFYELAAQRAGDAVVDEASLPQMAGKPVRVVVSAVGDLDMQVSRANVEAMRLLSQGRILEADQLLESTLRKQPENPFTLNNLGVAREIQGETEEALKYYTAAANSHPARPAVVTQGGSQSGTVSEIAAENARNLRKFMRSSESPEVRAARLNLRGVSALNRNDPSQARRDFRRAYALDPANAFSLNNLGYLAEMDGDWETAQFYYQQAQQAYRSDVRVGLATRQSAEGTKLSEVATDNAHTADARMDAQRQLRRQENKPIQLKRRGPVQPSPTPPRP